MLFRVVSCSSLFSATAFVVAFRAGEFAFYGAVLYALYDSCFRRFIPFP